MSNVTPIRPPDWDERVAALVEKQRYCPYTGQATSVDDVVLVGRDRAPRWLISQEGWREMPEKMKEWLANRGTVPMKSTIKETT